jgi:hypothetical protein
MDKKTPLIALVLTLLVIFFILIILNIYSPLIIDDYLLQFKISLSLLDFTDEHLNSHHDLFTNMWNHRYILNGRMSNNLAMLLLYTVGKSGFNIINSSIIILVLFLVCKLALGKVTYRNIIICSALSILTLPCIHQTIFWLAGSCNYLWIASFICGALFYLEKYFNKQQLSPLQTTLLLICAFIASSMHEGSAAIICGMLILLIIYQYRRKRSLNLLFWTLFVSIMGASIPLSAPGIWHRANIGAPNIISKLIISIINFIIHSGVAVSLLLICLYRKGIRSLLSPKGFYILSGLVCELLFGMYSASGRESFWLNLVILTFILPGINSFLNYKPKLSLSLSILIIISSTALQLAEYSKFDHVIKEGNRRAKNERIFSMDVPLKDFRTLYFFYGSSSMEAVFHQKQYSIVHGVPEHQIVFNTLDFDKKIYSEFPEDPTDEPVVVKTKDLSVIRLPKGMKLERGISLNLNASGKNANLPTCFLFRKYTFWEKLLVIRKPNRTLSLYSTDYQDGFFYIILPEPACHYHELTCSVALPDESIQELHIDLDKTYQKP